MDNNLIELINRIDNHLLMIQEEIKHYIENPKMIIESSSIVGWDLDELIWLFRALRSILENG